MTDVLREACGTFILLAKLSFSGRIAKYSLKYFFFLLDYERHTVKSVKEPIQDSDSW